MISHPTYTAINCISDKSKKELQAVLESNVTLIGLGLRFMARHCRVVWEFIGYTQVHRNTVSTRNSNKEEAGQTDKSSSFLC